MRIMTEIIMKGKKEVIVLACAFIFLFSFLPFCSAEDIEINSLLLKASVHEKDDFNRSVSITSGSGGSVYFEVKGIPGISLYPEKLAFSAGETKEVRLVFNGRNATPGIYVGSMIAKGKESRKILPIIMEVESLDVLVDANLDIPPQYTLIKQGGKIIAQAKIYDLVSAGTNKGLGASNVDILFNIYDLNGNAVSNQKENIVLDKQAQINKAISFPEKAKTGDYIFAVIVKYKSSVGISSQIFSVEAGQETGLEKNGNYTVFILAAVIIVLGFLLFFIFLLRDRDKMLIELRKLNDSELERQKDLLQAQAKVLKARNVSHDKIRKEIKKKLKKLRKKHEKREKVLKHLKKGGKTDMMKRQLEKWKKEGYLSGNSSFKLKELSGREMQSVLNDWKKKYSN